MKPMMGKKTGREETWGGGRKETGKGKKIPLITGKGEASLPHSFPDDHQGALPAVPTRGKLAPFPKPNNLQQTNHENHLSWGAFSQECPQKRCRRSPRRGM